MSRYRLTRHAQADLDAIYDYVAADNRSAADRLSVRFEKKLRLLASQPLLGQMRDDLAPNLRCFTRGKYVIFYRVQGTGVEVVRVIHGARDIQAQFPSEQESGPDSPE